MKVILIVECYETHATREQNSGRYEKIICNNMADISCMPKYNEWSNLVSIISIRRIIETEAKNNKSYEIYYDISSFYAETAKTSKLDI